MFKGHHPRFIKTISQKLYVCNHLHHMCVSDSYQLSHACINKTNTKWKIVLKRSLDPSGAAQIPTMHFTILHCLTFPSESMELTLQTVEATYHELNLVSTYFFGVSKHNFKCDARLSWFHNYPSEATKFKLLFFGRAKKTGCQSLLPFILALCLILAEESKRKTLQKPATRKCRLIG